MSAFCAFRKRSPNTRQTHCFSSQNSRYAGLQTKTCGDMMVPFGTGSTGTGFESTISQCLHLRQRKHVESKAYPRGPFLYVRPFPSVSAYPQPGRASSFRLQVPTRIFTSRRWGFRDFGRLGGETFRFPLVVKRRVTSLGSRTQLLFGKEILCFPTKL